MNSAQIKQHLNTLNSMVFTELGSQIERIGKAEIKLDVPIFTTEGKITDIIVEGFDSHVGIVNPNGHAYTIGIMAFNSYTSLKILERLEKYNTRTIG